MNDMTKIKNCTFISSYDGLASDDYCDRMIERFEKLTERSSNFYSGSEQYGAVKRNDSSIFFHEAHNESLDLAKETNEILDEGLKKYIEEYPSLQVCHNFYSFAVKVQKTPPKGGFHTWHCEKGGEYNARTLTWTIYLNDIPEGEGETEFLEYGMKVQPKKGKVCFFPSDWTHTHRGNPVHTHNKYIATGWYYVAGGNY